MSVNDELLNRAIRHAVYFDQLSTGEVNRMMKFMDRELFPDMKRILERRLGNIGNGAGRGAWTTARYKQMLKVLDEQINTGFSFMSQEAKARLTRVGMAEAKWAQSSLQQTVPLNVGFNTVDMNTVRSIVTSRPFQGALLKDWYKELGTRFKGDLRKALNIGLASGESIPQITARVMGIRGVEQGFTGSSLRAQMRRKVRSVVRTSSSHVAAKTRSAVYAENSDIIAKVRWVATLDSRTTDICQSLDGQEWKVGQEQTPPAHHQCRSTTVPVTKTWKQLGLNAKDKRVGGRAFRDVKTGLSKVSPTHMNYGDWLLKQPADVQNQILGTGRANLLRNGTNFSRFFSNNRALSLSEMNALEGITVPELATVPSRLPTANASEAEWKAFSERLKAMRKRRQKTIDLEQGEAQGVSNWFGGSDDTKQWVRENMPQQRKAPNPNSITGFHQKNYASFMNFVDDVPNLPESRTIFRGIMTTRQKAPQLFKVGGTFTQSTPSSASFGKNVARRFAKNMRADGESVIMEITTKSGKVLGNLGKGFANELEVVIQQGTRFRVVSVEAVEVAAKEQRRAIIEKIFNSRFNKLADASESAKDKVFSYLAKNDFGKMMLRGSDKELSKAYNDIGKILGRKPKDLLQTVRILGETPFDSVQNYTRVVLKEI